MVLGSHAIFAACTRMEVTTRPQDHASVVLFFNAASYTLQVEQCSITGG